VARLDAAFFYAVEGSGSWSIVLYQGRCDAGLSGGNRSSLVQVT
jgi:hypothetical protein